MNHKHRDTHRGDAPHPSWLSRDGHMRADGCERGADVAKSPTPALTYPCQAVGCANAYTGHQEKRLTGAGSA